jgi:hypothetical protein
MSGYTIIDHKKIEEHITFIRIKPTDIGVTLKEVFTSLSDLSWINDFDKPYKKQAFRVRAEPTIENLKKKLLNGENDSITVSSGETVVSELARKSVVSELDYLDIPLAELFKQKKDGNPGFDFFTENKSEIILFGEAKYLTGFNAYNSAFKQIVRFEKEERDISDLNDIHFFCSELGMENTNNGLKGFMGAFSSIDMTTDDLISNIKSNEYFKKVSKHAEVICIAVDV